MALTSTTQFGSGGSKRVGASLVEAEYLARLETISPTDRVARAAAMLQWMRETIGRQIRRERAAQGQTITNEELKGRIALRIYGSEPAVAALIQRRLADVSG